MIRGAIIIFLVNYCASLFSQELHFSRNFESPKKNLAVQIINNHSSYFYVLRQNKAVHDITVERRAKPTAEILNFTPLKLDSVNATWFDYENLDYITFEIKNKLYFLFEKVQNTKRTIYLKIIDTTGKSTGFIELANIESDNNTTDFYFTCSKTENNNILIIATKTSFNGITRKVALLYSAQKREVIWIKKLPMENEISVSWGFDCNIKNDLFYLQSRYSILGTETFGGMTKTITQLDSLVFWQWKAAAAVPFPRQLNISEMDRTKHSFIIPDSTTTAFISVQGLQEDTLTGDSKELITNIKLDYNTGRELFNATTFYDSIIRKQLTFYDGPEKQSYHKQHFILNNYTHNGYLYTLSERSEANYYKELLFRKTDLKTGEVILQKIIPRKIFFFPHRTRYKNIAEPMVQFVGDSLKIFLLENPSNFKRSAGNYNYRSFKKATDPGNANIVAYSLNAAGDFEKKLIFNNSNFELVPLQYSANEQKDVIFYFNNSKFEKFAILK